MPLTMPAALVLALGLQLALAAAAHAKSGACGCTADETCCKDSTGYACCIDQSTFCVAPNSSVSKDFPARCCPQWTVGCQTGSVGCCDPARPWQRTLTATAATAAPSAAGAAVGNGAARANGTTAGIVADGAAPVVYALFSSSSASDLNALSIDAATGNIASLLPVQGPAKAYFAKYYGESTRVFPFDPTRSKFFFIDIDQQTASGTSPITLYAVDPASGASSALTVKGATGFVMSFEYHPESASMLMAVGTRDAASFDFYSVDLDTASASKVGTVSRGASESDSPQFYAAYISAVGRDGESVLRLGYQQVTKGETPGLGTTPLKQGQAKASWSKALPAPQGEEFYYSLVRPKGEDDFLSLAPSTAFNHTLALVQWSLNGTSAVIANLPDAHPPETLATGILGYIADDASELYYAAMTVQKKPSLMPGLKDRWELVFVDRSAGRGGSYPLTGHAFDLLGAETVSCSGVGVSAK